MTRSVFFLLLMCLMTGGIFGVDLVSAEEINENGNTSICIQQSKMIIENDRIRVAIGARGEIISVDSADQAVQYLTNQVPESFCLTVDTSTSDLWNANPDSTRNDNITAQDAIITVDSDAEHIRFHYLIEHGNGTIEYEKSYSLDGYELRIESSLLNNLDKGVIVTTIPAFLHMDNGAMNCLWPHKTGTLFSNGIIENGIVNTDGSTEIQGNYPTPISMQLVTLFDEEKTISFTIEDKQAEFKTFSYKKTKSNKASVYCRLLPFLAPGEEKKLAPVVVSFFDVGNWTIAADHYREFLAEAGWVKEFGNAAKEFTGFNGWTMKTHDSLFYTKYSNEGSESIPQSMQNAMQVVQKRTGLDYLWITGWHVGGFDTNYPDFEFSEEIGGAEAFAKGVEEIHDIGGKLAVYLNVHMSDIESDWYGTINSNGTTFGDECASRTVMGDVYSETYPTGPMQCVAMCPSSSTFQKAIVDAARRLAVAGIDAIYLDQLSEMPSCLCFNPNHGHSTPATAYYEGYSKLVPAVSDILGGSNREYILLCEGVADCYGQWIDVFCGYTDTNFLPYTRYTFPSKIIGRDLASERNATYFSSAFVLGEPFVCHRHHIQSYNKNLLRYLSLYRRFSDLFLEGRYVFHNGFIGDIPNNVQIGIMESSNGTRSAIQLYNTSITAGVVEVEFSYNPPNGSISSVTDAETGNGIDFADGIIRISLKPGQTISLVVEYTGC